MASLHTLSTQTYDAHNWYSGWLSGAVSGLYGLEQQLVQAMASFGSSGAPVNSSSALLGADPSQQSALAAPIDQICYKPSAFGGIAMLIAPTCPTTAQYACAIALYCPLREPAAPTHQGPSPWPPIHAFPEMLVATDEPNSADPGLGVLVMLLRLHGIGADPAQIRHRFAGDPIGMPEMLRCAKEFGLKARSRLTTWERLVNTPLPAIVALRDGGFLLLGKVSDDKALVQSPLSPRPTMMTRAEFEAVWDGHLVLMTRRAGLVDLSRRFDITWFLGAIHKYRRVLGEVLVASFFLQVFRAHFAAVLPGRHRQGTGASRAQHARCADHRSGGDRRFSRPSSESCAPICLRTRRTGSMSSWARGCSGTWWPCRSPISRHGG